MFHEHLLSIELPQPALHSTTLAVQTPVAVCACGWRFDFKDAHATWQRGFHFAPTPGFGPSLEAFCTGYLTGVHAMHVAQLLSGRLDGQRVFNLALRDFRVETELRPNASMYDSFGRLTRTRPGRLHVLSLTAQVDTDTARQLEPLLQRRNLPVLLH